MIGFELYLKRNSKSIDDFLGLQYPRVLPSNVGNPLAYSKDCIAGRWAQWKESFDATGITQCPDWRKISEINTPTPELYDQFAKALPVLPFQETGQRPAVVGQMKINSVYQVSFTGGTADQFCKSPGDCAQQCASGFPGFVVRQDGETVLTDPAPWQRDTVFSGTNPYTRAGYYHPMSLYGALPGDIFSHYNRSISKPTQELCSYFDGTFHLQTTLVPNCAKMPDGTDSCVGVCAPPLLQ